jgi:putative hydrolase of the HAD superfamily
VTSHQAVIFDLYYTLLYDEGTGTREKAIEVAESAGIPRADWLRAWRTVADASQRGAAPSMLARVRNALAEVGYGGADSMLADHLTSLLLARQIPRLYPDVRATLGEVRRRGYRLGLVSNLYPNEATWLREFELDECFDALVLSCEVGLLKPEPEIYLMAAERLGVRPQECVFVDDIPSYLAGAKRAGMTCVRINRFDSEEPYAGDAPTDVTPDLSIAELAEFLDWLPRRARAVDNGRRPG